MVEQGKRETGGRRVERVQRGIRPYSSLPETYLLIALLVWIDLMAVTWPTTTERGFWLRAAAFGILLAFASAHSWFLARSTLWSNAPQAVLVTAAWLVSLGSFLAGLEWDSAVPMIGLLSFLQIAQCSFIFNHLTLRFTHLCSFTVLILAAAGGKLPLVQSGIALCSFAAVSIVLLAYDRTALKAGPAGYNRGEARRIVHRLATISCIAVVAGLLFAVTPRFSQPEWMDRTAEFARDLQKSAAPDVDKRVLDGETSLPPQSNLEIMRVTTVPRVSGPLYVRGQVFDTFDGERWTKSSQNEASLIVTEGEEAYIQSPRRSVSSRSDSLIRQRYELLVDLHEVVFSVGLPESVRFMTPGVREVLVGTNDRTMRVRGLLKSRTYYDVTSHMDTFSSSDLRRVANTSASEVRLEDRLVPAGLSPDVGRLARRIVQGATSPYEKALAIERYLQEETYYSLDHSIRGRQVVEDFLEQKAGHCALSASAMVMMARSVDLPARYVSGFVAQKAEGNGFVVRASDGHAWVEVYVDGAGWIAFDPTAQTIRPDDYETQLAVGRGNSRDRRGSEQFDESSGLYGRDRRDGVRDAGTEFDETARDGERFDRSGDDRIGRDGGDGTGLDGGPDGAGDREAGGFEQDDSVSRRGDGPGTEDGTGQGSRPSSVLAPGGDTTLPERRAVGSNRERRSSGQIARREDRSDESGPSGVRSDSRTSEPESAGLTPADPAKMKSDWQLLIWFLLGAGVMGLIALTIWQRGVTRVVEQHRIRRALPLDVEEDPDSRRFIVKLYHTMLVGLGRVGLAKKESETPKEYAEAVAMRESALEEPINRLTDLFHRARYSREGVDPSDPTEARKAWHQIARGVRRIEPNPEDDG